MKSHAQNISSKPLIVAGIMSGTSADGIDIALCLISSERQLPKLNAAAPADVQLRRMPFKGSAAASGEPPPPRLKLLAHHATPYTADVRNAVLVAMDAKRTSVAEISRLHWRLGTIYADALEAAIASTGIRPHLIALHGQTIYHQATAQPYLDAPTRTTWQIGEPSIVVERLRLPVISDFRPADLAAGGQGAPLVPMLDYTLFRHRSRNRVLLNLGGIANLTVIPAESTLDSVLAFDTGPASMVIDALMQKLYGRAYDCGGSTASRGATLQPVLDHFLQQPYFATPPPKSCGREQFGAAFTTRFLAACEKLSIHKRDVIATATAFTAATLREAFTRFCQARLAPGRPTDLIAAGGGAYNAHLMRQLREAFTPLGVTVTTIDQTPSAIPAEAKEAAAFALLGWLTWHQLPGNVPSATGATHPVILGKITYA